MARPAVLRDAPVRLSVWMVMTALVLMVLGFLVVVQLRSGQGIGRAPEVQTRNIYALASQVQTEREARLRLEAEVGALRRQLEEVHRASSAGRTATAALQRELDDLRLRAGLHAVQGPGVLVEVAEPPLRRSGSPVTVQYTDLAGIINELWAAGAEAVALNGVRLTANTGLSQVGPTIVVGLTRIEPPYRIAAIGDPATLDGALAIRGGLVEGLRALGLVVRISRAQTLAAPAGDVPQKFEHARPVP